MEKELRLRRYEDFKKAFRKGKRFPGHFFVLYMLKTDSQKTRFGVSISKSHLKLATNRNRVRRVAKELFKNNLKQKFLGHDFVLASRSICLKTELKKATDEVKKLMAKPIHGKHN